MKLSLIAALAVLAGCHSESTPLPAPDPVTETAPDVTPAAAPQHLTPEEGFIIEQLPDGGERYRFDPNWIEPASVPKPHGKRHGSAG